LLRAAILLGARPWSLTGAVNREAFHAAGQCYGNAGHWCCVAASDRAYFRASSNHIDRNDGEQSGNNDHGECVTHGNPSFFILWIVPIKPKFSVTAVTKFLFFVDSTSHGY
jgi:hypothetical protein